MRIGFFSKPGADEERPLHELPVSAGFAGPPAPPTLQDRGGPPETSATPPQLPPSLLRELERIAGVQAQQSNQQFQAPPQQAYSPTPPPAPAISAIHFNGTLDGGVLDAIHACRQQVEQALAADAKEYQILKMLNDTDLGVCSELAGELRQRLASHALFQIVAKLDEAYTLALRYQTPRAARS